MLSFPGTPSSLRRVSAQCLRPRLPWPITSRPHPRQSQVSTSSSSAGAASAGEQAQPPSTQSSSSSKPAAPEKAQSTAGPSSKDHASSSSSSSHTDTLGTPGFQLSFIHVALFTFIFVGGAFFATVTLQVCWGLRMHAWA